MVQNKEESHVEELLKPGENLHDQTVSCPILKTIHLQVSLIAYSSRLEAYNHSITAIQGEVYAAVSSLERWRRWVDEPKANGSTAGAAWHKVLSGEQPCRPTQDTYSEFQSPLQVAGSPRLYSSLLGRALPHSHNRESTVDQSVNDKMASLDQQHLSSGPK